MQCKYCWLLIPLESSDWTSNTGMERRLYIWVSEKKRQKLKHKVSEQILLKGSNQTQKPECSISKNICRRGRATGWDCLTAWTSTLLVKCNDHWSLTRCIFRVFTCKAFHCGQRMSSIGFTKEAARVSFYRIKREVIEYAQHLDELIAQMSHPCQWILL